MVTEVFGKPAKCGYRYSHVFGVLIRFDFSANFFLNKNRYEVQSNVVVSSEQLLTNC